MSDNKDKNLCQHCFGPLNATKYTGLYECPQCVRTYGGTTLNRIEKDLEQTRVQLAGCSCAALGAGTIAKKGEYGWSPSYQDVLNLRQQHIHYKEVYDKIAKRIQYLNDGEASEDNTLAWIKAKVEHFEGCQHGNCNHKSDCAVHDAPYKKPGKCDCGLEE